MQGGRGGRGGPEPRQGGESPAFTSGPRTGGTGGTGESFPFSGNSSSFDPEHTTHMDPESKRAVSNSRTGNLQTMTDVQAMLKREADGRLAAGLGPEGLGSLGSLDQGPSTFGSEGLQG